MTSAGDAEERVALFAAGALPPDEGIAYEAEYAGEAAGFTAVVEHLARAVPAVEPPSWAKEKILARLGRQSGRPPLTVRFADDGGFVPTKYPGVWARVLHTDCARQQFTALLRLDPGATYPGHSHDGPEECLVLEGELLVGSLRLRKGDYQRAEMGSEHVDQRTETGATVFLTAPLGLLGD